MSTPQPSNLPRRAVSGASLGLVPQAQASEACDELTDSGERYLDGGVLGRGGMGEIRVALDMRLGRHVAVKIPAVDEPALVRQFVAEAKLTARLAHPGIVAIHDAGIRRDGRPYYTMPIIEGRSLAEALVDNDLAGRLRLVRHFLHACEAVAYAHSERIVHRDLKPANLLIGRFGETLVVDWGLAGPVGERSPGVFGTPAYMAPEQASGDVIEATADVYALGVSLREIVTGSRRGDREGPRELMAIADRATRPVAAERYANAGELAEDIAAWFEGRRVAAHRYGVRELALRLWMAHRTVLSIAVLAVIGIAAAIVVGAVRAGEERARAQASEHRALAARETAESALAESLVAHAVAAAREDDWPAAELYAVDALRHGPSDLARGVLAQFDGAARPVRVARHVLPDCRRTLLSDDAQRLLCVADGVLRLGTLEDGWNELVSFTTDVDPVALTRDHVLLRDASGIVSLAESRTLEDEVVMAPRGDVRRFQSAGRYFGWLTGASETWAGVGDEGVTLTQWCPRAGRGAAGALARRADGARLVACQDGTIFFVADDATGEPQPLMMLPSHLGGPVQVAFEREHDKLAAIALTKGAAVVIDVTTGRVVQTIARAAVTPTALAMTGHRLAIADDMDRVEVWDVDTGVRVARIAARGVHLHWLDDGTTLRIVSSEVEDFRMPAASPRAMVQRDESGVAALAIAPDGKRLVTAHGDGHVRVADMRTQHASAAIPLHWSVAKDVDFSPDGKHLVAASAQDSTIRLVDLDESMPARSIEHVASSRVAWLADDVIATAPYGAGIITWHDGGSTGTHFESLGRFVDMESDPDRRAVTALAFGGEVVRVWATGETQLLVWRDDAEAVAGSARGVVVLRDRVLETLDPDGDSLGQVVVPESLDLAITPDHTLAALAHADGTVSLWDLGALERVALLRAHGGRVGSIAFDATGEWLVTSGWDGAIRQWSMRDLRRDAESLAREVEGAWGRVRSDLVAQSIATH